jgi:hypothetical protein
METPEALERHRRKLQAIFTEVLFNEEAQNKWLADADPDFMDCLEVLMKKYDQTLPREQWLRTGVMFGAVYEQWRQKVRGSDHEQTEIHT